MGRSVGFGRPQPQVALLPPPVPHDAPPTRMTSDFESLVRVYVMMLYDQPAAPRTAFFQGLITWRNTYASCRWLFSFTRRWPRPTVRTCFWMHRHRTPNQRAICPHNSIWKSVAGEFCTEVHINTSWISSRENEPLGKTPYRWGIWNEHRCCCCRVRYGLLHVDIRLHLLESGWRREWRRNQRMKWRRVLTPATFKSSKWLAATSGRTFLDLFTNTFFHYWTGLVHANKINATLLK